MLADMNVLHWKIETNAHLLLKYQYLSMRCAQRHAVVGYNLICFVLQTLKKTNSVLRSFKDLTSGEAKGIITTLPHHIVWGDTKLDQNNVWECFCPAVNSGEMRQ